MRDWLGEVMLNDGRELRLSWLGPDDGDLLARWAADLADQEIRQLDLDLKDSTAVSAWCRGLGGGERLALGAFDPEAPQGPAGWCELRPGSGSHAHLGWMEWFIHPEYRDLGLGSGLIREMESRAQRKDLAFLVAEVALANRRRLEALKTLGFELKAIMEEYRVDRSGEPYDVVVLLKRLQLATRKDFLYRY